MVMGMETMGVTMAMAMEIERMTGDDNRDCDGAGDGEMGVRW